MMRLEGRAAARVEAAFWDRLMRLPPAVLHRHPAGDLAMSGMTFQNLRDGLQGVVADSLLSVVFLLPVFAVIFFYDATLGGIALVFSIGSLLVTVAIGLRQIAPYGRMIGAVRRVAGRLFQIVDGIAKLRVENAEGSAFAIWAQDYREQKRAELELGAVEGHARAFGAALPFLAGGVLLCAVVTVGERNVPVGDFLVVYTVFIAFQAAIARLGDSFGTVAAMVPAFDQMRPLLDAVPETEAQGEPVERLGGEVLFDRVSFRYEPDGPLILDDVTIRAEPGDFVAIAGESGAGKSTLFRLALGIDRPTAGAVYYDGRDLRHLNLKQVRRMIGAVPQSVRLYPHDLWDNIVAHHEGTTTEDVWQAARAAGIEREIKAMPMGMMTMVGGSGSVLSGGESQRVTHRPLADRQPANHAARRGDELARQREPGRGDAEPGRAHLHPDRHRPPALHTAAGGPHLRAAGRTGRAERRVQRAHGGRRGFQGAGQEAGRMMRTGRPGRIAFGVPPAPDGVRN